MNDLDKYNITRRSLIEYYNNKIKNTPKEELDLYKAQDLIDESNDVQKWLEKLYTDNAKEE